MSIRSHHRVRPMGRIHIGTSGWHYRHWKGRFYPPHLASSEWLSWYAQHFSCVELNASFYRLPNSALVREWIGRTPQDFLFAVKAGRVITHRYKLAHCEAALERLLCCLEGFGSKLGPVLFQLPPNWNADPVRLEAFLRNWQADYACVFEFRNPDWWREEIYRLLDAYNAGFCQFDLGGSTSPEITTGNLIYLRLHGPEKAYCGDYPDGALEARIPVLNDWRDRGFEVYVFFDNDENGFAVKNAWTLKRLCRKG